MKGLGNLRSIVPLSLLGGVALCFGTTASADVLYNTGDATTATIAIGVNDEGHLNASPDIVANASATGLAYKFPDGSWRDATAPGCLCEGWGVSASGVSGYANVSTDGGANNLTVDSFTSSPTAITSAVHVTSLPGLQVSQTYQTSDDAPDVLFRVDVTITNATAGDLTDVRYVRVMDWDIPPTEFDEYVTIRGTATTTLLETSGDNGFNSANPLAPYFNSDPACLNQDCIDSGPADHGAYFRFNFGTLAAGESYRFSIFYGAAGTEAAALAAIAAEGIELFSLGQSLGGAETGEPATFIFGFRGVGGDPVFPVPEPGSLALMSLGLLGLGFARRRRV